MLLRWFIFFCIIILCNWYSSLAIKTVTKNPCVYYSYLALNFIIIANFIIQIKTNNNSGLMTTFFSYSLGFFIIAIILQITIILFLFIEDFSRLLIWFYSVLFKSASDTFNYVPQRRLFLSQLSILLASIPASALFIGMLRGKYNYKVIKHQLSFERLPDDFNNFKIAHISDFHCGSFDNKEKLKYGIDLINKQEPDIILFTGDMVNNIANEVLPWKEMISSLKAPYGKYSILGNHDYGDYAKWDSEDDKVNNLKKLIKLQNDMGFKVLLNSSEKLHINQSSIELIGVENWGSGGFKKNGDLDVALKNTNSNDFKILMSHDPSHWQKKVISNTEHIDLTLSGHTHGMQFGIEIPGLIKWSPIQYRYKYWAGIYQEMGRVINVNRGFGFLAYPGRVGIYPEISIINLKKKKLKKPLNNG